MRQAREQGCTDNQKRLVQHDGVSQRLSVADRIRYASDNVPTMSAPAPMPMKFKMK